MKNNLYDKYVHNICRQYIKDFDNVLDVGCGDSEKTKIVYQYSKNVIASDLEKRTKNIGKIPFRNIGINKYGEEEEFDVVTSFDVIEHVEKDESFLREISRILKVGGRAIIGTPNRKRLSNKIISIIRGEIKYPRSLGYHYESGGEILHLREYTKNDLERLANKVDEIEIIEIKELFVGLYTPLGPIGIKNRQNGMLNKFCQHLFLIIRKKN